MTRDSPDNSQGSLRRRMAGRVHFCPCWLALAPWHPAQVALDNRGRLRDGPSASRAAARG
eukprot:10710706-Alexandrium_andersonii.AAC.1